MKGIRELILSFWENSLKLSSLEHNLELVSRIRKINFEMMKLPFGEWNEKIVGKPTNNKIINIMRILYLIYILNNTIFVSWISAA